MFRGPSPQKLVDLILLAHDDELVVTVHNQLFRTVFNSLPGDLTPTTVMPNRSCTRASSME